MRRAEDLVGLLIAGAIALSTAYIIWESIQAIRKPRELDHLGWVFAAGVVGFLGNEIVAVYRIRIGKKIGSVALIAKGKGTTSPSASTTNCSIPSRVSTMSRSISTRRSTGRRPRTPMT